MDIYYFFLVALAFPQHCEAFVFTSTPQTTTTVCDGETVTLNWAYTSGTPDSITWTKNNNDSTYSLNASIASFSIGSFIPDPDYASRVAQGGNNAAINISDVTPADDGVYQVEITDSSSTLKGNTTLTAFDIPKGTIKVSYLKNTRILKCDGLTSLGSGSLTLELDGNPVQSGKSLSLEVPQKNGGRYCCCVTISSDFDRCLPAGESFTNCSALCVDVEATTTAPPSTTTVTTTTQPTDIATTPTTGSTPATPPPDDICKNNKCYWFILILILIPITIAVVVCCYCCCGCCGCCRKKKKDKSNSNSNVMNSFGEKNESVSAEPQVNNDKSDLTRV